MWWPGLDRDLEGQVGRFIPCQETHNSPSAAPLHPWEWPQRPWVRVHVDYAVPFLGHMFLILVDDGCVESGHSTWMEILITKSSTSSITTENMRSSFATLGVPELTIAPPSLALNLPSLCGTMDFDMSLPLLITLAQMGWQRGPSRPSIQG